MNTKCHEIFPDVWMWEAKVFVFPAKTKPKNIHRGIKKGGIAPSRRPLGGYFSFLGKRWFARCSPKRQTRTFLSTLRFVSGKQCQQLVLIVVWDIQQQMAICPLV